MNATDSAERFDPAALRQHRRPRLPWRDLVPLLLYQSIFLAFGVVSAPVVAWRALTQRGYRRDLRARTGRIAARAGDRPTIWLHGVSVGEVKGLRGLVDEIAAAHPELEIVLSSTTPTGFAVARELYPERRVFHFPLDFGPWPGRALDRIRPSCVLLMELEIWPNFLFAAARRGVPVAVVNGRISEKSFRGYRKVRALLPQFERIAAFCVQDEVYRSRLLALGVPAERIAMTGNMKYDNVALQREPADAVLLRSWLAPEGQRVVVAGSTHAHEEEWLAAVVAAIRVRRDWPVRLVMAPRHPDRAPAILETLGAAGHTVVRWSEVREARRALRGDEMVLVDTIGQLEAFYAAGDVAFVGGSLVPHGGQNMIEPAALGRAVVFGPHTTNFRADVELLLGADAAVQVATCDALEVELEVLLADPERRAALGARAIELIRNNQGAAARTRRLLAPLFEVVRDPGDTTGGSAACGVAGELRPGSG